MPWKQRNWEPPPLDAGRMAWLASTAATCPWQSAGWPLRPKRGLCRAFGRVQTVHASRQSCRGRGVAPGTECPGTALFASDAYDLSDPNATTWIRTEGERAMLLLNQGRYKDALEPFLLGGYVEDADFVALGVLYPRNTAPPLTGSPMLTPVWWHESLGHPRAPLTTRPSAWPKQVISNTPRPIIPTMKRLPTILALRNGKPYL